jgi:hypothetical protein
VIGAGYARICLVIIVVDIVLFRTSWFHEMRIGSKNLELFHSFHFINIIWRDVI